MIELKDENMSLLLSEPEGDSAYYRGVRFDRSGVFRSISFCGNSYADEWFDDPDPFRHDHICGPVEEFAPVMRPSGKVLKIGVGLLDVGEGCSGDRTDGHYDRFKLYPVVENGMRMLSVEEDKAVFTHVMPGEYEYVKTVRLAGDGVFEISHLLANTGTEMLETDVYNHNFFTLGRDETGQDRCIDLPFIPEGEWREDSVSAYLTASGIRFRRALLPGEKAFMGNLHPASACCGPVALGDAMAGYSFSLSDKGTGVDVSCDVPMDHAVFWSNHRVCCLEPYILVSLKPGRSFAWTISYRCRTLRI